MPARPKIIAKQIERKVNCPLTSSIGRLFDAVAAIAGVRGEIDYEAQAAIELEMAAPANLDASRFREYPYSIEAVAGVKTVRLGGLFRAVLDDVSHAVPVPEISTRLHITVARMTVEMCQLIADETGLRRVALSGGVFQNRLLLRLTVEHLKGAGFEVLTHHLVPCNDGGISLGQAAIAHYTQL